MHAAVFRELYGGFLSDRVLAQLTPEAMTELWGLFVTRGDAYLQWVAVDGDEIVGFAGVGPGRETGYAHARELYFLVVAPHARRRKVGRALVRAAEPDYTWVWDGNRDAQRFYRTAKFFPDSIAREGALFGAPIPEVRLSR
jgi:GNAT superfamily N-acetyltransferase